jgi:hypothetical protein
MGPRTIAQRCLPPPTSGCPSRISRAGYSDASKAIAEAARMSLLAREAICSELEDAPGGDEMTLLKLRNEAADPAAEINTSIVYAKDLQGTSQSFVCTADGRVSQLTPSARLLTPGGSLSGTIASSAEETIELLPGEHTLDADVTGDSVTLRFRRGAVLVVPVSRSIGSRLDFSEGGLIRPAAETTVTINGPVMMPDTAHCFDIGLEGRFGFGAGTMSYLTPCHFGALLDDMTDAQAAIQAAIDSLPVNGGVVRFPLGRMVSYSQINVDRDYVTIEGMGWGSELRLQTDAAATLFSFGKQGPPFKKPDGPLRACAIRNISLSSGLRDGDFPKTAIDVHDAREFLAERIEIQPWRGRSKTPAIGLRVRGRDAGTYRKLLIHAGLPILLDLNTEDVDQRAFRDVKDMDHHTFADLNLVAYEAPGPVIKIMSGFVIRNTTFTGYQAWVLGGLEWVDDEEAAPRDFSNNVAIQNVRADQIGRHPSVFAIDIQKDPDYPLHELSLSNCLTAGPGGGWNGVRVTGVENLIHDRTVRYEGALTSLVADGTVDSGAPRDPDVADRHPDRPGALPLRRRPLRHRGHGAAPSRSHPAGAGGSRQRAPRRQHLVLGLGDRQVEPWAPRPQADPLEERDRPVPPERLRPQATPGVDPQRSREADSQVQAAGKRTHARNLVRRATGRAERARRRRRAQLHRGVAGLPGTADRRTCAPVGRLPVSRRRGAERLARAAAGGSDGRGRPFPPRGGRDAHG